MITWVWLLVSSPKCFCYCVYFDICPSTTQSVYFDTYSIVIVLTSGHAGGWINTSVSCLVKLPLWCCNYPNTCLISTLSIHYDIYSTTIVLTGGQTCSWSAITVFWFADTQKGGGGLGSLYLVWWWFIYPIIIINLFNLCCRRINITYIFICTFTYKWHTVKNKNLIK